MDLFSSEKKERSKVIEGFKKKRFKQNVVGKCWKVMSKFDPNFNGWNLNSRVMCTFSTVLVVSFHCIQCNVFLNLCMYVDVVIL